MTAEQQTPRARRKSYEVVDHTADWALRVWGVDMAALLANAAEGMSSLLVDRLSAIPTDVERNLDLEVYDAETLLVDWLSELAYWAESEMLVFNEFKIHEATRTTVRAVVRGGRVDELLKHIKAVTYHDLQIIETENGLEATIVFDV